MRIFWEIFQFELRQQLKSPFVLAVVIVFFLIHFLTATSTGIHLWAHPQANLNSAYAIAVTETTLAIFGMLPVIVFVAKSILRDHDSVTAALFFVKPIGKQQYVLGRFAAACLLAIFVGWVGLLGSLVGTLMPWLDQELIAPFTFTPFLFSFFAIMLPNMVIQSALFFSAASLSRSFAATVALAMVFLVGNFALASVVLSRGASAGDKLLALADHSGALLIDTSTYKLTINELNTVLPHTLLLENRLMWLAIAGVALWFAYRRFRFEVSDSGSGRDRNAAASFLRTAVSSLIRPYGPPSPATGRREFGAAKGRCSLAGKAKPVSPLSGALQRAGLTPDGSTSRIRFSAASQFASQLRMDFTYVIRSPLFLLIVALGVFSTINEHAAKVSSLMNMPFHPLTSTMLGFFRYGLIQFVLIIAIYYSGVLVSRERESGVAEIVGGAPFPDWILPLSKMFALCGVITALLAATMLTSIAIQAASGQTNFEFGLYLKTVFLHNGFYFWMLCVLAIVVQVVVSNKWLGMLLLFVAYLLLLSLGALGFEHILYGFGIPYVVYSDMNGFAHSGWQLPSLMVYWGFFCILLFVAAHLLYVRGIDASLAERVRGARIRLNTRVALMASLVAVAFIATGSWIFYNTNVLNAYRTTEDSQRAQADYEIKYGAYENRPTPSFAKMDIAIDVFPQERRLESRGTAYLRNNKQAPIEEFVVSVSPRMRIAELNVEAASRKLMDPTHGFYLFALEKPLQPGKTVAMTWRMSRINQGFANSDHDTEVVENGTFVMSSAAMPVPGFNDTRKLTDDTLRKKFELKPAARLAELGDPAFLDNLAAGIDGLSDVRVVLSTSADQIAATSGQLKREWQADGRRYFEYVVERPILPVFPIMSGRYEVARDRWNDIDLEVYFDPKHRYNIDAMLATTKRSLDYFTRAFAPYPYAQFRIIEYPRYRTAVKAVVGGAAYSESGGFILNLEPLGNLDYATIHELAHTWWGTMAYGARMQGREVLNETLAQYSTLMVFKKFGEEQGNSTLLNRIIEQSQRGYLAGRNRDGRPESPLMHTDDQGNISYNKGPLVLYALQELIGEDAVNQALRNYLAKFAFKPAPFPTSRDLVNELRAVAGAEHQNLITDLFEKIVLYDLELKTVTAVKVNAAYEVSLTVAARQLEANGQGEETEVPLATWFDVSLFSQSESLDSQTPLYLKKHLLHSGSNVITIQMAEKPVYASVDPFQKMADRRPENNGQLLAHD